MRGVMSHLSPRKITMPTLYFLGDINVTFYAARNNIVEVTLRDSEVIEADFCRVGEKKNAAYSEFVANDIKVDNSR